jgi:hypothetical protein
MAYFRENCRLFRFKTLMHFGRNLAKVGSSCFTPSALSRLTTKSKFADLLSLLPAMQSMNMPAKSSDAYHCFVSL